MPKPVVRVSRTIWRASGVSGGERAIPEETAVAFTFNTASYVAEFPGAQYNPPTR